MRLRNSHLLASAQRLAGGLSSAARQVSRQAPVAGAASERRTFDVKGIFVRGLVSSSASWPHHVGFSRGFHSTALLSNSDKDSNDSKKPDNTISVEDKPIDDSPDTSDPESGDLVPRRGRRKSGTIPEVGIVKRDSKWTPNEVLVIPVYRRPIFPGIATPIALTNAAFCEAILKLKGEHGGYPYVGLFLTKDPNLEEGKPVESADQLHQMGCLGQVVHIQGVHQLGVQLLIAGTGRVLISGTVSNDPFLTVSITKCQDNPFNPNDLTIKAYVLEVLSTMKSIVKLEHFFKEQLQTILAQVDVQNPALLADVSASMTTADRSSLQNVLECVDVQQRLVLALTLLRAEREQAEVQKTIHKQMEDNLSKMQRKHFLTEQLKIIKKELGLEKDEKEDLVQKMTAKLAEINAPPEAEKVIMENLNKLSTLDAASHEFNMTRTYLEWLVGLPWGVTSTDSYNIDTARETLDKMHFGMKDVKDRILEFIAVGALKNSVQGKIVCFVGPPGVGKTSIGRSIAESLGRKFFRFSVGGMTDVAEIKGHRRTYVGAMPGKLVQALKTVGTKNPLIMLDEIDKLGRGYQGDPASALLEVLDPSQNKTFMDHYLDVPLDLSQVLFICTANSLDTIPGPLKDRMEIIQVSGYTLEDKMHITRRHLLPQALSDCGVEEAKVTIAEDALRTLIHRYCREPGVRNLQKQIEKLLRKVALQIATKQAAQVSIDAANLETFVGPAIFPTDRIYKTTPPGVVMGLAWTSLGGVSLFVESVSVAPAERASLRCTGQMGDVMKESSEISFAVARKFLKAFDPTNDFFDKNSIHLHIPEGATPKDGPSAGVTMTTALLSLAMNRPAKQGLAMTGELSLTGMVLPVGGIKEKVLAAQRAGATQVLLPAENRRDWVELDQTTRDAVEVVFADSYDQVFKTAFGRRRPKKSGKASEGAEEAAAAKTESGNKAEGKGQEDKGPA